MLQLRFDLARDPVHTTAVAPRDAEAGQHEGLGVVQSAGSEFAARVSGGVDLKAIAERMV